MNGAERGVKIRVWVISIVQYSRQLILTILALLALLSATEAQGSEWKTVREAFGKDATCESLPVMQRIACIRCEAGTDASLTPMLRRFLVLVSGKRIESTQCRDWYLEAPSPADRTLASPKWFVRKEPDMRCALLDLAPGSICENGVVTSLSEGLVTPQRHRNDVCDLIEVSQSAICRDSTIIDPLPKEERQALLTDPCLYMLIPEGASCYRGIIVPDRPKEESKQNTYDPCTYADLGQDGTCNDGKIGQRLNSSLRIPESIFLDNWDSRERMIAQRADILKKLAQNRTEKEMIRWQETAAHLRFVATYGFSRISTMLKMASGAADVVKTVKLGRKLIDQSFNIANEIQKNIDKFQKERDEIERRDSELAGEKKRLDNEIAENERREIEQQKRQEEQKKRLEKQQRDLDEQKARDQQHRQELREIVRIEPTDRHAVPAAVPKADPPEKLPPQTEKPKADPPEKLPPQSDIKLGPKS